MEIAVRQFFTLLVLAVCLGIGGAGGSRRLAGTLDIKIVDGEHFYTFDYVRPKQE